MEHIIFRCPARRKSRVKERGQTLLREQLANGPGYGELVKAAAAAADISERNLIAAAERLGVRCRRGQWWLPAAAGLSAQWVAPPYLDTRGLALPTRARIYGDCRQDLECLSLPEAVKLLGMRSDLVETFTATLQ